MPLHTLQEEIEKIIDEINKKALAERDSGYCGACGIYQQEIRKALTRYADQYEKSVVEMCEKKAEEYKTRKRMTPFQDTLFNHAVNVINEVSQSILSIRKTK